MKGVVDGLTASRLMALVADCGVIGGPVTSSPRGASKSISSDSGQTSGMRVCRCKHIWFEHGPQVVDCVDLRGGLLPETASAEDMLGLLIGEQAQEETTPTPEASL